MSSGGYTRRLFTSGSGLLRSISGRFAEKERISDLRPIVPAWGYPTPTTFWGPSKGMKFSRSATSASSGSRVCNRD